MGHSKEIVCDFGTQICPVDGTIPLMSRNISKNS